MLKRICNIADGYKRNRLCIAIAVLSILIFFAPNYRKGLIEGSDAPFHLARIDSLAQDLSKGIFPVKVHTELGYDYGYGVGMIFMPLAIVGMEQFLVKDKPPILLGIGFGGGYLWAHLDRVYGICGMFAFGDSIYKRLMEKSKKNRISFGNGGRSAGANNILLAPYVGSIQGSGIQGIPVMDNS